MRIVFVIGSLNIGGTETQVCRLATELQGAGHQVKILLLAEGGPLESALEGTGVEWEAFGYRGVQLRNSSRGLRPWVGLDAVRRALRMCKAMREFRPQVVHAFLFWACVIALPGAAVARIPIRVAGRRGITASGDGKRFYRFLEHISDRSSHAITANSKEVARVAIQRGALPGKLRVIPNGVDLPSRTAHPEFHPPCGLVVANLIPYKGYATLIEALELVTAPVRIRAIGEGPQRPEIESRIEAAGLEDILILEGTVPNARNLWQEVQFGVLPSYEEGMPNAILEAMAAGVPVVATTVGGVPELVLDGVTGLLVPPGNAAALACAIERILVDSELRLKMGQAARLRSERFTWAESLRAHLALYDELRRRG